MLRYNYSAKYKQWEPPGLIQNKIAKNILLTLAIGAGAVVFLTSPYGLYYLVKGAVQAAFYKNDLNREIRRLERKGYISLTKTPKGWIARLLKRGKRRLKREEFQSVKLPKTKDWDKKWRLLIFDIPEKDRISRNLLRRKLKELGMYNFQRSVFVYPYDCRKELAFITDHCGLSKYTTYAEVSYSDIDRELRRYFKL